MSFALTPGDAPVILSMPHVGLALPERWRAGLIDPPSAIADADYWIDEAYDFTRSLGVTILKARLSRVVIDLNRPHDGASLYPGQATTGLVPLQSFDGAPLYHPGKEPGPASIAARLREVHKAYHDALAAEIARLRGMYGRVVLLDCHSIRSHVPRLFDGELPILNLGTNDGQSCARQLGERLAGLCAASRLSHVVNGRFKGGWITRHYGRPESGVHAVQLELAQRAYMAEPGGPYNPARAAPLTRTLEQLLGAMIAWAQEHL